MISLLTVDTAAVAIINTTTNNTTTTTTITATATATATAAVVATVVDGDGIILMSPQVDTTRFLFFYTLLAVFSAIRFTTAVIAAIVVFVVQLSNGTSRSID